MSNEEIQETPKNKPSMLITLIVAGVVGLISGVSGFYVTSVLLPSTTAVAETAEPAEDGPIAYIPFGETVVNLQEDRMTRYLRVSITLQVAESERLEIEEELEAEKPVLKSWVLSHLSDCKMDDVRGAVGQNRQRRVIHNYFNSILFDGERDAVQDVLFEEFTVQ